MAGWPSGYVMLNCIECDRVISGSSPSLCNILYDNFWVLLPSPLPIPDPSSLPAHSQLLREHLGANGCSWSKLPLQETPEVPNVLPALLSAQEHNHFFLMLLSFTSMSEASVRLPGLTTQWNASIASIVSTDSSLEDEPEGIDGSERGPYSPAGPKEVQVNITNESSSESDSETLISSLAAEDATCVSKTTVQMCCAMFYLPYVDTMCRNEIFWVWPLSSVWNQFWTGMNRSWTEPHGLVQVWPIVPTRLNRMVMVWPPCGQTEPRPNCGNTIKIQFQKSCFLYIISSHQSVYFRQQCILYYFLIAI